MRFYNGEVFESLLRIVQELLIRIIEANQYQGFLLNPFCDLDGYTHSAASFAAHAVVEIRGPADGQLFQRLLLRKIKNAKKFLDCIIYLY